MILSLMRKHQFLFLSALFLLCISVHAVAQDLSLEEGGADQELSSDSVEQATASSSPAVNNIKPELEFLSVQSNFNRENLGSILFTAQERLAIFDSVNSRGLVRPIDPDEAYEEEEEIVAKPPPEKRYIRLGGILYKSKNNWTIWLNGQRVTPNALPNEILDLSVSQDYVEMKWFDDYTKQILPIRLRANQRFHIDARMFLPG